MRYLKPFNESINKDDMQEYCEMNLAYLLDEGLQVSVSQHYMFRQKITSVELSFPKETLWLQIKDHIMPFLHRISNAYTLDPIHNFLKDTNRLFQVQMPNGTNAFSKYNMSYDQLEDLPEYKIIQKITFNLK
jgi:hypothetical protein